MPEKVTRPLVVPTCRVNKDELKLMRDRAAQSGLNFSEFQRRSLMGNEIIIKESIANVALIKELNFIGKNLNQLVKRVHIHNEYDREHLHHVLNNIDTVLMELINDSQN